VRDTLKLDDVERSLLDRSQPLEKGGSKMAVEWLGNLQEDGGFRAKKENFEADASPKKSGQGCPPSCLRPPTGEKSRQEKDLT